MNLKILFIFVWIYIPIITGAQWLWKNPLPQGNTLHNIQIRSSDQSVWACGSIGTIIHSDDEGLNWNVYNLIRRNKLVEFISINTPDDSTIYATDQLGYIFKSTNDGYSWDSVYFENDVYLQAASFTSSLNGYIVGDYGKIIRTTDGGATWTFQHTTPRVQYKTISFPTETTGYAAGLFHIMKTTNSGNNWNSVFTDSTAYLLCAVFPSSTHGIAAGEYGKVVRTTDGGLTWTMQQLGDTISFTSIGMFSPDTILLNGMITLGTMYSLTAKFLSTDGGNSWTHLTLPYESPDTKAIACFSGGLAYGTGYNGVLTKSEDYGYTWEILSEHLASPYNYTTAIFGMDFPSVQTGYAVTGGIVSPNGSILKTIDGGETWFEMDSVFYYHNLRAVDFVSDDVGFIAGDCIYSTSDGGQSWICRASDLGLNGVRSLSFASPLIGVAVGENGNFLRTTDGGQSWGQVSGVPVNVNYYAVHFPGDLVGYAAGNSLILKTVDAGATWTHISDYTLRSLWFTDSDHGIGVGFNSLFIRTTDGGMNWQPFSLNANGLAVHFFDADTGYISGADIFKTIDGGQTWIKQTIPATGSLNAIRCTGNSAYTGGGGNRVFGTTNGGIPVYVESASKPPIFHMNVYPNPFTDQSKISYMLKELSDVEISFYDSRGIRIHKQLVIRQPAGIHITSFPFNGLSPGVYFCRIRIDRQTETRKIVLIR